MAHVSQGENRLAAVTLAACHGAYCASRGNGGLGGVTDAILSDASDNFTPIHHWPTPIQAMFNQWCWRLPGQGFGIVNAAFDNREGTFFLCQGHAGAHGMVAHELHHLRSKRQRLVRAVPHADMVH